MNGDTSPAAGKSTLLEDDNTISVEVRDRVWTIDPEVLDDWELLEDLNDKTGSSAPSAMRRFLGQTQYDAAKEMLRDPSTKRIAATAMSGLLEEIFVALKDDGSESQAGNR